MVGMDDKHRKLLRKKRMDLVRDMDGDRIASFLFSSEIFSEEDKDLVQAETTPQKKNEKLLDILPKRGGKAFDAFCNALRDLGMSHLVVLLKSEDDMSSMIQSEKTAEEKSVIDGSYSGMKTENSIVKASPSVPSESEEAGPNSNDIDDEAPDQGDGRFWGKTEKKPEAPRIIQRLPSLKAIDYNVNSDNFYTMDKYPRGLFLLINNKEFLPASGMENYPRNGTDVDAAALESMFTELGFIVHRYDNVDKYSMRKLMKQAAVMDYSNLNCFTCAILTHGEEGVLYATDGRVDIREVTGYFREDNLAGKPKFFIFQACQGSEYMDGLDLTDGPARNAAPPIDDRSNDVSLPSESDFLYAYSTVPGYYSWRNSQRGSWFIQGIIEVFRAYAHKMDVLRMLTRVNGIVATKKSQTGQRVSNNKRQIASIVTQMRKEFFLFPPQGPLGSA